MVNRYIRTYPSINVRFFNAKRDKEWKKLFSFWNVNFLPTKKAGVTFAFLSSILFLLLFHSESLTKQQKKGWKMEWIDPAYRYLLLCKCISYPHNSNRRSIMAVLRQRFTRLLHPTFFGLLFLFFQENCVDEKMLL